MKKFLLIFDDIALYDLIKKRAIRERRSVTKTILTILQIYEKNNRNR